MSVANPIPRSTRETIVALPLGTETSAAAGAWKVYDVLDVQVRVLLPGASVWTVPAQTVTVALTGPAPATVTASWVTPFAAGTQMRIRAKRVHERSTDVTRGGTISSAALEAEHDRITTVLQEVRRDTDEVQAGLDAVQALVGAEFVDDRVAALLRPGTGVQLNYDDAANTLTIAVPAANGIPDFNEAVQDLIGAAVVAGPGLMASYNDPAGTVTIGLADLAAPAIGAPRVTPEMFGAVGDYDPTTGTGTDNTTALNAMFAHFGGVGSSQRHRPGIIVFPGGKLYRTTQTMVLAQYNVHIEGNRSGVYNSAGGTVLRIDHDNSVNNNHGCSVSGLWLSGNSAGAGHGIHARSAPQLDITECEIKHFNFDGSTGVGPVAVGGTGILLEGCVAAKLRENNIYKPGAHGILHKALAKTWAGQVGGPSIAETQAVCIMGGRVYYAGSIGVLISEGGGHWVAFVDIEKCNGGLEFRSAYQFSAVHCYFEANGVDISVRNLVDLVPPREVLGSLIFDNTCESATSVALYDGDDIKVLANRLSGASIISAAVNRCFWGRQNEQTGTLTDLASDTVYAQDYLTAAQRTAQLSLFGTSTRGLVPPPGAGAATRLLQADGSWAAPAVAATPPKPNLIINPGFKINQRAFAGGALAAGAFGHDRWRAATGGADYSVSGRVVTLASGEIEQVIETDAWGYDSLASTSITVSVADPSADMTVTAVGTSGSASGTITAGSGRRAVTLALPAGATGNITLRLKRAAAGSVSFSRPKVEEGTAATDYVARQQGDELRLCRRYFQRWQNVQVTLTNDTSVPRNIATAIVVEMREGGNPTYVIETGGIVGQHTNAPTLMTSAVSSLGVQWTGSDYRNITGAGTLGFTASREL